MMTLPKMPKKKGAPKGKAAKKTAAPKGKAKPMNAARRIRDLTGEAVEEVLEDAGVDPAVAGDAAEAAREAAFEAALLEDCAAGPDGMWSEKELAARRKKNPAAPSTAELINRLKF